MARPLRRALGAAAFAALAAFAAAALAGACNPGAYDDYTLGPIGAASGPGGPATECNGFFSNDASCQSCFVGSTCCSQAAFCDEDCKGFIGCQSQCDANDVACREACKQSFSFAQGRVDSLLGCLGDACAQCAGLESDAGPIGALPSGGAGAGGGGPSQKCEAANACAALPSCLDCDQDGTGSCETDTAFSRANCGACGHDCLFSSCVQGKCLPTSVAAGVRVARRLVAGGGYLYWVTTKSQNDEQDGDAVYRVKIEGNNQTELAYALPVGLAAFDVGADATGFYFVTATGAFFREHVSTQPPRPLAAAAGTGLDTADAPARARVSANSTALFFSAPPAGGAAGTELWRVDRAGGTPTRVATFTSNRISTIIADEGGVYVGSHDSTNDAGVWYAPLGGSKKLLYGTAATEFAVGGEDLLVSAYQDFKGKLVTLPKTGDVPETELVGQLYTSTFRSLAADASGLYYLVQDSSGGAFSLSRVRREPGAQAPGAPVVLVTEVSQAQADLPLALDATSIYTTSAYGTALVHVAK